MLKQLVKWSCLPSSTTGSVALTVQTWGCCCIVDYSRLIPDCFKTHTFFSPSASVSPQKKSSTWHRLSIDVKSTISISHSKPIIILQNVPKHHQNTGSMKRTAAWSGSAHHGFRVQRAPAPRPAPREMQRRWPAVARRWESAARPFWRCHRLRNALGELELGDRAGKKTQIMGTHIYIYNSCHRAIPIWVFGYCLYNTD